MNQVKDGRGIVFAVGQKVAKADKLYKTDGLFVKECIVTKVNDGKVYLDDSPQPMKFPDRVLVISL